MSSLFFDFTVKDAKGNPYPLANAKGKVALVVNVASRCGFTPQYKGLEMLQREYGPRGFTVLGFPSNQFGAQEPGTDSEIQEFCSLNYDVTFPVLAKIDVNGPAADPLYGWLKSASAGSSGPEDIKWNFAKFLIGKDGKLVKRYPPQTNPEEIAKDIDSALKA